LFTANAALLPDHVTGGERTVQKILVVVGPVGDVLHPFASGIEEVLVHRRGVVARLDQFELYVPGVGQGHAHLHVGVRAAVSEEVGLDAVDIKPGPDTVTHPVVHCGVDVAHDVADLGDLSEPDAHVGRLSFCSDWRR
jgi:hypothetical protein